MSDFPTDYPTLKEEYLKLQKDFEDQNQIYEEYINSLETTKKDYEKKLQLKEKDFESYKLEASKLREAVADRNKDIDYLEKELEKEQKKSQQFKEKLSKYEGSSVELEMENTNLSNKIRELESWGDDLKIKLEAALEENIILHTEMDSFKAECDEKIQRIQEELEDNKNEVLSKEKLIEKLTNHRDFLLKTANKDGEDIKNSIINKRGQSVSLHTSIKPTLIEKPSIKDSKILKKVPDRFLTQISSSFINYSLEKKEGEDENEEERDYFITKIQNEVRAILDNRKNFLLATLNYESFSFDVLNLESNAKAGKIRAAVQVNEVIDEVLSKLKERKDKVLMQKRLLKAKFEKLGIKI